MNEKEDQKQGEKNWDNDDCLKKKKDENKDPKKLGKDTHLKRRRFW